MGLLFKYTLGNAWFIPLSEISIYDDDRGTVKYWAEHDDDETSFMNEKSVVLDDATITKIREMIQGIKVDEIEKLEHVCVLDGNVHSFVYAGAEGEKELHGDNIIYCKEQPKLYPNTMVMIKLLNELKDILAPLGVDKKCFSLSRG